MVFRVIWGDGGVLGARRWPGWLRGIVPCSSPQSRRCWERARDILPAQTSFLMTCGRDRPHQLVSLGRDLPQSRGRAGGGSLRPKITLGPTDTPSINVKSRKEGGGGREQDGHGETSLTTRSSWEDFCFSNSERAGAGMRGLFCGGLIGFPWAYSKGTPHGGFRS